MTFRVEYNAVGLSPFAHFTTIFRNRTAFTLHFHLVHKLCLSNQISKKGGMFITLLLTNIYLIRLEESYRTNLEICVSSST